jgi:hypothetical protein
MRSVQTEPPHRPDRMTARRRRRPRGSTVEPAVTRAVKKVVGEAEGHHVEALGQIRLAGERSCADDQAVDTTARATFGWRRGTTTSRAPTREGA